jgi:hypothetical protein
MKRLAISLVMTLMLAASATAQSLAPVTGRVEMLDLEEGVIQVGNRYFALDTHVRGLSEVSQGRVVEARIEQRPDGIYVVALDLVAPARR